VRVERLAEEFEMEFDACAYDLKPGIPPEGLSREQVYAGRVYPDGYIENMQRMAAESGIEMKRPALIPNTRKAHEATEFAREHGALLPFHRAVFHAYWTDERNVGDREVLCDVASQCGLDPDGLNEVLTSGHYAPAVESQVHWSREAGITGVPTIIFEGRFAVVGAQDYEVLRDVAQRALTRPNMS
jgi:predicted DsbA family dithiol-disulfide isomerase